MRRDPGAAVAPKLSPPTKKRIPIKKCGPVDTSRSFPVYSGDTLVEKTANSELWTESSRTAESTNR